jgi:hypothetical protein
MMRRAARRAGRRRVGPRPRPAPTLIVFAKEPGAGRVKTRLGRDIGPVEAAWWARHQLRALLRRVSRDPRWRTVLAVSPDTAGASRALPKGPPRIAQGRGDLGARMARALAAPPPGPVVLVGADIPGIRSGHVARAFALLGRHEAVLGPAEDGGYWLIGLRRGGRAAPRGMLAGVRWSGPHALADTAASLAPLSVGLADRLADVDTADDLARVRATERRGLSRPRGCGA